MTLRVTLFLAGFFQGLLHLIASIFFAIKFVIDKHVNIVILETVDVRLGTKFGG